MKAPEATLAAIEAALAATGGDGYPCERERKEGSCIGDEMERDNANARKRSDGMRKGWMGYESRRMCPACAAHWHISCARNYALGLV